MNKLSFTQKFMWRLTLGLSLLPLLLGSCSGPAGSDNDPEELEALFNDQWAMNAWWDDGLAEVATYAAERVIYDKVRTFDYTFITVKEDFNKAYNVKTDSYARNDLFPVMKVNQFCRIPTDNYPYHFMSSLFFRRQQPLYLHKLTSSSQEWCGQTFKAVTRAGNRYQFAYNSYWDGQGAGKMNLDKGILFEDQLPYTLRSVKFTEGLSFSAVVAGLLQNSKANEPEMYPASFRVRQEQVAGKPVWRVTVALTPGKQNSYWFAAAYPHILLRQQTWDGRSLQLKTVKRYAYWQH